MPRIKSAKKKVRVDAKKRMRNVTIASAVKTAYKKAYASADGKSGDAPALLRELIRSADKAVSKGIIHKNTAARKKSRLMRKLATAKV